MKTNLLSNLSNGLKKGTGLTQVGYRQGTGKVQAGEKQACGRKESLAWSQVEPILYEAAIEHPLSTHSAPFGIRWKPAGEKGSTRVWKYVVMIFAVLVMSMASIGTAWGVDFTAAQIISGTTSGNISVSTAGLSNNQSKNVCSGTKLNSVSANSGAGATYSGKYIEIKASSGYSISTLNLLVRSNNSSACNGAVVFWNGDASATCNSYDTFSALANSTSDCDGTVSITVPSNTRTIRIYRGPKINPSTKAFDSGSSEIGGTSTFNVFSVSATVTVACTEIHPSLSYTSTSLMVGDNSSAPTLNKDGSAGAVTWTSSDEDVATVNSSGVVTAEGAGTATITASIAANGGKCEGSATANFTVAADPVGSHTITYTLSPINTADASLTSTQTSTSTYLKNLTTINASLCGFAGSPSKASNRTAKINRASSGKDDDKYIYFTFEVEDGYQFTPTAITIKVANVSNATTFDASLISSDGPSVGATGQSFASTDGTVETWTITPASSTALTGTVTLKIWPYAASAGSFRFGTPITIDGTVAAAVTPSCTAPDHVDISGRWDRFGGETISLTATAYSSAGTGSPIADGNITGWQWEKLIGSTWTPLSNGTAAGVTTSGATTKNLQIANCGAGNSGKYRCIVSTGATCSTASATATDGSEGLGVKVYVLECYNGGTTEHHFTRTGDTQAGTLTMTLSANTAYTFKVHADNTYYGNSGTIDKDETNWVMCNSDNGASCGNLTVNSGLGGTFTFGIEYSTSGNSSVEGEPELSVTYPRKTMYLVPNSDWTSNSAKFAFYYYGNSGTGWTDFLTSNDCGMSAEIPQWNGITVIAVRFNPSDATPGWNGDGHVWNQTNDITLNSNNSVVITGWNASDFTYGTYAVPTYTISYNAGTGGSGTKASESKTCGVDFTLPNSAVFTRTGYTQTGWAISNGGSQAYALGGSYTGNEDKTFYPVWTVNNYDLTWNLGGGTTTSAGTGIASGVSSNTTSSVAYGTSLTAPTVTKTGYNFSAWSPTVDATMPASNTTYTATWTAKTTTITIDANTANHGSTTPGTVTATWGSALPSFTAASGVGDWSLTGYWTAATGGNKIINADGTLVASTSYADGSSLWNSEAATLTLYAQYEEECTPQTISKVVLTAVDAGTVSGYNENEYAGAAVIGGLKSTNTAEVDASHAGVETGYKLNDNGKGIVFATLAKGTFQVGDVIKVTITYPNDNHTFAAPVSSKEALELFYGTNKDDATSLTILTGVSAAGTYSYTLTAADVTAIGSKKGIGVFRHSDRKQNPFVYSVEIYGCRDWVIEEEGLVNWTMNLNTNTWGTSSTSTTDETNISSISTSANTTDGTREGTTKKINLASAADNVNNAASFTFSLNSAKKIEPEKVTCKVFNVGDDEGLNYKAQLSDDNGHVYYSTNTVIPNTEATLTDAVFNFASDLILTGDITVKVYCWKSSGSGSAFRMGPKIRFFGEVQSAADYTVTHTLSNVTKSSGETSVKEGNNYTATYAGAGGYALPSTITVTIGGSPATAGTDYTWTQGTGVVTIPGNKVTGNIVITVTGVAIVHHDVDFTLTHVEYSSGDDEGTDAATEGSAFSTVFAASSGYDLPSTITVTIGGSPATVSTDYTWNKTTGALEILAASVTGDIVITIVGTEHVSSECITITHWGTSNATTEAWAGSIAAENKYRLSHSGGSTSNNKSTDSNASILLYYGTTMSIYDSPTETTDFENVTSVSFKVKLYSASKKPTITVSVGSGAGETVTLTDNSDNSTFQTYTVNFATQQTGAVKVRNNGSGDSGYKVYIDDVQICTADMAACTTPVIPSLSDQALCEGDNAAAWNATQTAELADGESVAYQWQKKNGSNWDDISGATTATYDVDGSGTVTEAMAGTYRVVVTVSKAGYSSSSATREVTLSVTESTEVTGITANKAKVYPGNSVTLTATANTTVTWQWYTCTNAEGAGESSISGATSAAYTIASAGSAGTYYYKAKGSSSCGTAERVYTLTVTAASECQNYYWFIYADDATANGVINNRDGFFSNTTTGTGNTGTYTMTVDGVSMTGTKRLSTGAYKPKFTVPAGATATLYIYGKAASSDAGKHLVLKRTSDDEEVEVTSNTTVQGYTKENIEAGEWTLSCGSSNWCYSFFAVKVCSTSSCTDATPTIAAVNNTVCSGTKMRIDATGYETGATFKWQKLNTSTSSWDDVAGATLDSLVIASVTASNAGSYRFIATKGCARTSNTVTIAVPSAPVFNSFSTTRSVMATLALSISDVEASDAVSYKWYKSADATWDAGDTEIGSSKTLTKAYAGETAGSTYYVICRAQNSCGTTTSSAIAINVIAYVEEDCATRGNENDAEFGFTNTGMSSGTYDNKNVWYKNSNSNYLTYSAPEGKYLATAKVTIASSNSSNASYQYSTNNGTSWSGGVTISGLTTSLTEKTIILPANVTDFRIGRNLDGAGESSGTFYLHKACFIYAESCTATMVTPSESSVNYEMGGAWSNPTFTLSVAGTLTYSSSNEDIASVDDYGTVTFNGEAGTVTITASYAGGTISATEYCASSGSYTINVSCPGGAPKIVPASSVDLSGCNASVTLNAKKQDGTAFADGTYQWFRNGEEIDGATSSSYTATQAGTYTVERTNTSGCTTPSTNSAVVTSETTEPEVERLVPFQYYHVDKTYTDQMKMRHLFAVKNSGKLDGKSFKLYVSRNGAAATDVTSSNALAIWPNADGRVDSVMVDLNKLTGKYAKGDELVYTCKAIDCENHVSETYKNTITMHVIDTDTATLALICSGASGDGTRKTKNLVVGGDFLTGYNKADLCVQTGNESFDKTQEWGLYTELKDEYIVTPVNGYAPFYKLNYEPFDILFLTDYPKASKSDAAKDILDDMAALCDYRPLFSFKTHMVAKTPSKWAAKGFTTSATENKSAGRLNLNIVCYAHRMFDAIKTGEHVYEDNDNTSAPLVYTMLSGEGYEGKKGMQGFEIAAAENFVTIGLTHYNARIAMDSPDEGLVTWTPDSADRMLVTVAERQANLEARMILFSVNAGAHSKLTDKGEQVVLACLEYLLDTDPLHVADCSFYFDNGEGAEMDQAAYKAMCPLCSGTIGDHKWSTQGNWGPDYRLLPGEFTAVRIEAPVTVDLEHAHVREVRIEEGGSIEIPAGKALDVKGTIRHLDGSEISPTGNEEISIGSSSTGNGTLIFNNNTGDTKARVAMYTTAKADAGLSAAASTWQYIGTPYTDVANARSNYYGSWLYQYGSSGWEVIPNGGPLEAFRGYCITHPDAPVVFDMHGTLAATTLQDISVPAGYTVIANSWVAPIDISTFTDDDMENISDKTIYFFNTGTDVDGNHGTGTEAGTYVAVPKNSASYVGTWQIPSMQGFYISTTSAGTLHLDYDRHVRPHSARTIVGNKMYAPRRAATESEEPNVLKIFARGSRYQDKLVVLEREDFTRGYDSGWDGEAWGGGTLSPMVYVTGEGREDAVSAIPEFEGTVIAFKAGEDNDYHFDFIYDGEESLYLFDTENNTYTQIMTGESYYFSTDDKAPHSRFILTRRGPQIATGIEPTSDSSLKGRAKKLLIENKMYILLNGALYDATGKMVK